MKINVLQQPPFRCVDDLVDYVNDRIRCNYVVKADNPMLEEDSLPAEGLIECMAQTAAVKSFLDNPSETQSIGYLVSVKNLEVKGHVKVGNSIIMDLKMHQKLMQFSIFDAKVYKNDQLIIECELRTFDNVE